MTPDASTAIVVQRSADAMLDEARALTITDDRTYANVADFAKAVKTLLAQIDATFDPHIKRAYEAHRALCAERNTAAGNALTAERIAKKLLVDWDTTQAAAREDERRRVEAIERQHAIDRTIDNAIAADAAGDHDVADDLLAAPVRVAAAVAPTTPKIAGVTYRETWTARVTSIDKLVAHVAAHPDLIGLLLPNMPALNAQARSLKARLAIPGVEAVCTKDAAIGRG